MLIHISTYSASIVLLGFNALWMDPLINSISMIHI